MRSLKSTAVLLLTISTVLTGCATTLSKPHCQFDDWEKVGYQDGVNGEPETKIDHYIFQCREAGVSPNAVAYESGREHGLKEFCTPKGAFRAGAAGIGYQEGVCKENLHEQWMQGARNLELRQQKNDAQKALNDRRKELDDDHSVVGDIAKGYHVLSGTSQTQDQQDRVDKIDDELYKNQRLAPEGSAANETYSGDDIGQAITIFTKFFEGGIAATIGFGSGHAIAGHYKDSGWKWTVIDAATLTGLIVLQHNCPASQETVTGQPINSTNKGCGVATFGAIIAFMGARIWEAIEVVNLPSGDSHLPLPKPTAVMTPSGAVAPGMQATYSF